jgi:hypothetical protein
VYIATSNAGDTPMKDDDTSFTSPFQQNWIETYDDTRRLAGALGATERTPRPYQLLVVSRLSAACTAHLRARR